MMTSTTTLAIGTGAGSLALTAVSALFMGVLGTYTLVHHRRVFAWTQRIRRRDQANTDFDKPAEWLGDLYKAQCRLAQKPCADADFGDVRQAGNMIKGIVGHVEVLRPELTEVVERVGAYVATALPDPGPAVKVTVLHHRAQLVMAMRQEAARNELVHAILAAEKRIKAERYG
ncbi:hypothetical protein [Streptomyces hokutonensis]|uniref:hypothetical protein n=1 Tax=Streptomyces hokutonensis TaxID=1306990 RepID=UPI00037DA677|nr:hypothetical protein [Streptomyces hokutonensis]